MLLPSLSAYESSGVDLICTAQENGVEAICYGSFVKGKARAGLSDIDFLVYSPESSYFVSPRIQEVIGGVIYAIEYNFRIPIQVTWTTEKTLGNQSFFSEDEYYLQEVRKGYESPYKTANIETILKQKGLQGEEYDKAMIRFFQRKLARLGPQLPLLRSISTKNIITLTEDDEKRLRSCWDILKKGIHICSLIKRIRGEAFEFSIFDLDSIPQYNPERYKDILLRVTDLRSWFEYLKSPGAFEELEKLITEDFEKICIYADSMLLQTLGGNHG